MKNLFNGTCWICQEFKPQCGEVHMAVAGKPGQHEARTRVLCADCRRLHKGEYRLMERHKKGAAK